MARFFCIFHALSFELNFLFDRRFPLMCTVAVPDHNPRGGGQLPYPNEFNSTLTSATRGIYPFPYI